MTSALELIHRRSALTRGLVADRSPDAAVAERGWRRMAVLLEALGKPQLCYRTVHVAGSKGKGTTTWFIAALLQSAGLRAGRYVSPHLLEWNERIAVDGKLIADPDFDRLLTTVDGEMSRIERAQPEFGQFNTFELLTGAAFLHFREQQCDVAVVEVGLGGRFDSTNHLNPSATVITRIEMEHVDILGPTLETIAWNKSGVIRPGVPVIASAQDRVAWNVIEAEAEVAGAPLMLEGRDWWASRDGDKVIVESIGQPAISVHSGLPGRHNRTNVAAAVIAVRTVIGDQFDPVAASADLASLMIPGRFDRRLDPRSGRTLILDGAHTAGSIAALIEAAAEDTDVSRFPFIVNLLADKPASDILGVIAPHATVVVFPRSANARAWPSATLVALARELGTTAMDSTSLRDAIDTLPVGTEPVLITGSFGIVADGLRMFESQV